MKRLVFIFVLLYGCSSPYDTPAPVQDWTRPPAGCPTVFSSGDTIRWEKVHHIAKESNNLTLIKDSLGGCLAVGVNYSPAR
jgi:hypothetical protein